VNDDEGFERTARIIAHRAPEATPFLVDFEVVARLIEVVDALEARLSELAERVERAELERAA
jgi:hypothetical protein